MELIIHTRTGEKPVEIADDFGTLEAVVRVSESASLDLFEVFTDPKIEELKQSAALFGNIDGKALAATLQSGTGNPEEAIKSLMDYTQIARQTAEIELENARKIDELKRKLITAGEQAINDLFAGITGEIKYNFARNTRPDEWIKMITAFFSLYHGAQAEPEAAEPAPPAPRSRKKT
jgi:hypothetical protein